MINSRLAQLFSSRFDGFAYFAVGYIPPNPNLTVDIINAFTKQALGYETFGYWLTHSEPGAAELIESHV
jgi:soluble epoxide hydrolase / lipid-phosphate phosphatase